MVFFVKKDVKLPDVYILSGVRTPIGSFLGSLSTLNVSDLGAVAIKGAIQQAGIPKEEIQEVIFGMLSIAGNGNSPVQKAVEKAGLQSNVICSTVNKLCASSMKSVMFAAGLIQTGAQDVVVAGGMESMSTIPFIFKRGSTTLGMPNKENQKTPGNLFDGLVETLTDPFFNAIMGKVAEETAKKFNITRKDQDEFALLSYKRSAAASESDAFKDELVPVEVPATNNKPGFIFSQDEEYKRIQLDKFHALRPVFDPKGTITSGNASTLNDGAAAVVLASGEAVERLKVKPLARIVGYADGAVDPVDFTIAPTTAINKLLDITGVKKEDVALWEINEAFSVVALANVKLLGIDMDKVNVHGGGVSLGHPVGMSGARLVLHLAHTLQKGELGVASICNGGGGASAVLIEKL